MENLYKTIYNGLTKDLTHMGKMGIRSLSSSDNIDGPDQKTPTYIEQIEVQRTSNGVVVQDHLDTFNYYRR